MIGTLARYLGIVVAGGVIAHVACSAPARAQGLQPERLAAGLDQLAADLALLLADGESRGLLLTQIEASKNRTVPVREALATAIAQRPEPGGERLMGLAAQVQQIEVSMTRVGVRVPRVDLSLPVPAHAGLLGTAETIYVVAAPLTDESEARPLIGHAKAERVTLDAKEPPTVPTLVVGPAESQSLEPTYPLQVSAEPGDEANPRRVDDFFGIPEIRIADDHESWACGNPEIYVVAWRQKLANGFSTVIDLPGVNAERTWYSLGDPNSTYLFYDSTYSPYTTLEVWEEDNSLCGGSDDFLGSVTVNWSTAPFSGYTTYSDGDMKIKVDHD